MRSSSGYGRRTGRRAVFDPDAWIRALLVVTVAVVSLSALACAVALVRDTRGHDWYATGKLTLTELLIGIGFDDSAQTEYRTSRGEVLSLTRAELKFNGNALVARGYLLRTARQAAELGACCGFGGALLCLALFRRQDRRHTRRPAPEPALPQWPGAAEGSASPQATAQSLQAPLESRSGQSAPVREPPARAPDSPARRPREPVPAGERDSGNGTGKTGARSTARQRRKRDFGRWI